MSTQKIEFPGFALTCPAGWEDLSDYDEDSDTPLTLGEPEEGVGVLQFSPVIYVEGEAPEIEQADLVEMFQEFVENQELGQPLQQTTVSGKIFGVRGTFRWDEDLLSLWYLSDGSNVMMATYVCEWEERSAEAETVDAIMQTLEFVSLP